MRRGLSRGIAGWDVLTAVALVGVAVAAVFALTKPKASPSQTANQSQSLVRMESSAQALEGRAAEVQSTISARTWNVGEDALGSEVLSKLTQIAKANGLQLNGFRSGRAVSAASLREIAFVVVYEGPFMNVMSAVKAIEKPESKLALSQLKISSKNDSDEVTATLVLTGFLFKEAN